MTDQQQPNGNNSQEVPAPPADTTGADTHAAAAAAPSNTSPSRPLLGDLARSAVPSLDVAQAARRTMAVAGAGPSGTSGPSRSGHHKSSSSRRHHHAPAAAASSHQSALRQATASVALAAVSPPLSASGTGTAAASSALAGLSLGANAAAAAAASPAQPSAAASGMPPRSPPHRAHSAADIGMAPGGEALRRNNSSSAVGGGGGMYQSLRNRFVPNNSSNNESNTDAASAARGGGPTLAPTPTTTVAKQSKHGWSTVEISTGAAGGIPPCPRSLHAAAAVNGSLCVFGGYDGQSRLNDFHAFHFAERRWSPVLPSASSGPPPSPRDRHVALVHGTAFFVFGGFDGTSRVADFFGFDFSSMTWRQVTALSGGPPSPRHSHSAVVHTDSAYIYGGYDGSYRSDFHQFNFTLRSWTAVNTTGRSPRARYRATTVVHCNTMVLFGGHDGTRHLADTHIYNFDTRVWTAILTEGSPPIPRDSHVAVVHMDSMYIFGGSTGSAMNDLLELQLPTDTNPTAKWRLIETPPSGTAGHRFCHVAVEYEDSLYCFGGYDGGHRLNDFIRFDFDVDDLDCIIPPSTLTTDLRNLVNDDALSDVTFIVEDRPVYAHKVLLMRSPYFQAMFLGPMMESSQSEIRLEQVGYDIFLLLLEYLYTDAVRIPLDAAMDLFAAANQFSLPRLQAMCEKKMLESITIGSAATIFLAADLHSADNLRTKSLKYILAHFEQVSKTEAFEEMARGNVELVFEILRNR